VLDYVVKGLLDYVKFVRKNGRNLRKNEKSGSIDRKIYNFV
jgi:hypothetical protein